MTQLLKYYGFMHEDIEDTYPLIFFNLSRYEIKRGYKIDSDHETVWFNDVFYYIERPYRVLISSKDEIHIQFDPIAEDKIGKK